jgi:hypothetical protein
MNRRFFLGAFVLSVTALGAVFVARVSGDHHPRGTGLQPRWSWPGLKAGATMSVKATTSRTPTTTTRAASPSIPGFSFRNHVVPVMTKAGCNSGACHGAASGKNGFKLTLRGYDPDADYETITRHAAGRRVNAQEPARSLILLKPTETLPHLGGKRFTVESAEYNIIAKWISAGLPPPRESDPRIQQVSVQAAKQTLGVGEQLPLRVTATFSNGRVEDVTRWARYTSADESVAAVDEHGRVTIKGHGETAINVGYLSRVASTRVRAPFPHQIDPATWTRTARHNFIDDHVLTKLQQLRIAPSPLASDEVFIRRAYLDAAGILPARAEVDAFLVDRAPGKRDRLVAALMKRPEFVDYWAYKWSDVLLVSSRTLGRSNVQAYYKWIRDSVEKNASWDRMVRELTTATGRSDENGAVNFFLIHRNPIELSENYTQAFLGLTLTCARCHNHPLEKWTQRDYYGFANLFARVSLKEDDPFAPGRTGGATVVNAAYGDIPHPKTGRPLPPRPLDGMSLPLRSQADRREFLARWTTAPSNTLFARTIVNRVWANFFGRGLVHPVDDLRATNPASNEELLDAVTRDFVAGGFDINRLIRTIMASAAYQRSSEANETNTSDDRYYSRYIVRRLPAEVILDAVSQVLEQPEKFAGYPMGTRALQLPDTRVKSYFLTVFGRPDRIITSSAERQQDATLAQALHIINGDTLNRKLMTAGGSMGRWLEAPDESVIDELFLAAYSRRPTAAERARLIPALRSRPAPTGRPTGAEPEADTGVPEVAAGVGGSRVRRIAIEDVAWAIFTSKEFLFNH